MKLSLNWIQDFVDISGIELSRLVYDLTMSTVEVEEAVSLADSFKDMVIGVVRGIRPHPDADKLAVCSVDIGDGRLREIVCGGINLTKDMKVAAARPGARVRWHGEGGLVELKVAKVRGIESYGMICASSEIGLFDLFPYTDEATIVDLSGFDAPAGTPLAQALGLDDVILTIDNKSLTNRPDLWGHYGMARELAAIYDLDLKEMPSAGSLELAAMPGFPITITDPQLCPRYIGVKIGNVSQKPAPFEIQSRIWRVGMRPINAIVDITNYIMLETGSPTHAFDADVIKGGIIIRPAEKGENLRLLDGKDIALTADDLIIADETEPIALAGVMGGGKDSILTDTVNIILEIANFNALSVRRTAMRYDTRTEAAARFEKGIDPQRAHSALECAFRLFPQVFPDMKVTGFCDNYPAPLKNNEIDVSLGWLEKRLGRRLAPERISNILGRLGFKTDINGDAMHVLVPSWRSTGDVSLPDDIMEEIARIYGFENFDPAPITTQITGAVSQPRTDLDRHIREYLANSCGMNEIYTYPWAGDAYIGATMHESVKMHEMASPPSPGERRLRASLIPGLCKAVAGNLRYFECFSLFESAQVFFDSDYTQPYDGRESLPMQRKHIAGAIAAPPGDYAPLYRQAKGILEHMPRRVHMQPIEFKPYGGMQDEGSAAITKPRWADGTVYLAITAGSRQIGNMGLLSQRAALGCGIKNAAVMLFELDIDALEPLPSRENTYRPVSEFPITDYDISLLFDKSAGWEDIRRCALGKSSPESLLRDVSFVEEYTGRGVPEGKKSVTLRLVIGSYKKTLTSEEIESCAASAAKRLKKDLGAITR